MCIQSRKHERKKARKKITDFLFRVFVLSCFRDSHFEIRGGLICFALCLIFAAWAQAQDKNPSPVGVGSRVEQVIIPGTEVEVVPHEDRKLPIRLRIVAIYPHGTAFRYDLEYQGLEPGKFDLRDYLRRKDGSPLAEPPALP